MVWLPVPMDVALNPSPRQSLLTLSFQGCSSCKQCRCCQRL